MLNKQDSCTSCVSTRHFFQSNYSVCIVSGSGDGAGTSVSIGSEAGTSPLVGACPFEASLAGPLGSAVGAGLGGAGLDFVIIGLQNLFPQVSHPHR
jgi:hypothetical protein